MDTIKIGRFLAELRHEKGLTQEQAGERLGVTNKTVSRWENGNYMPPVEALQMLSELYGVSINEILSGRRLDDNKDFKVCAEENLKKVLSESAFTYKDRLEFFRKKWKKEHIAPIVVEIILLTALFIWGFICDNGIQIAALIAGIILRTVNYNQMMAYAEKHAFEQNNGKKADGE